MEQQKQLQSLTNEYQSLQNGMPPRDRDRRPKNMSRTRLRDFDTDMSTLITARQKLESQQQENKGVQKVCDEISRYSEKLLTFCQEFNSLADDANIYKLVGPVLLKQDTTEAKSTVDGRLEYIGGEMYASAPNGLHLM
jgi:prefoldin beta subunit